MELTKLLRMLAATVGGVVGGAVTMATGRVVRGDVRLEAGDRAPDFSLPGSDGRTYRLADLLAGGQAVVLAWFPKAFTGG